MSSGVTGTGKAGVPLLPKEMCFPDELQHVGECSPDSMFHIVVPEAKAVCTLCS